MPRSAASAGLISMNIVCCSSASHLLDLVSSPPPAYSTNRPDERMSGNCLATPLSTAAFLYRETHVGQPELFSVGQGRLFGHQLHSRPVDRLTVHWNWVRQIKDVHACLGVAVGYTAVDQCDALNAAG